MSVLARACVKLKEQQAKKKEKSKEEDANQQQQQQRAVFNLRFISARSLNTATVTLLIIISGSVTENRRSGTGGLATSPHQRLVWRMPPTPSVCSSFQTVTSTVQSSAKPSLVFAVKTVFPRKSLVSVETESN